MEISEYIQKFWGWAVTSGIHIIITLFIASVALKIARILSKRMVSTLSGRSADVEYQKRTETLGSVVKHVLTVLILIVATMMVLKELGIEIGPVLAAAGVVGLAIGFGAQNLVQDVISGFFILLEDQIRVGDVVQIAGQGGLVEKVNLRMTILRDLAGNVHYVRNGKIDLVTNMTKEYSRYVFNIGVAYREDVDDVIDVVKHIDEDFRNDPLYKDDILEPIEILGLDEFADSAIIIKARYKTKPIQQWRIGREFNRRMKKKFDELNIEIPFPHQTIYMGEDRQGKAPSLNVSIKEKGTV
ncbi:MAG: mechanosensitive ion channel family protein [Deltaproteobacteria bacterium]|nr:mechanosensitive ion channel family protein [Deltaproteobacteria bacterium]